ncbi:MAG: glycosyltransferase [Blastomonas sp.]
MNEEQRKILIVGSDVIMPKLFYFSQHWRDQGVSYAAYTHDRSANAFNAAKNFSAEIINGPPHSRSPFRLLKDFYALLSVLRKRKFLHVEMYCDYHMVACFGYLLILKAFGVPIVAWFRGELKIWDEMEWWQRRYIRILCRIADVVLMKEVYMPDTLSRAGIDVSHKSLLIHNTIPLEPYEERSLDRPIIRLLYLNMFTPWRNVPFCIEVANELRKRSVPFTMTLVGDKPEDPDLARVSQELRSTIAHHKLTELVKIEKFTDDPKAYFLNSDIFLLPADGVFCNYALLESMAHGLIPMVADIDPSYQEIVENGVSGMGLPLSAQLWAEHVEYWNTNRSAARELSKAARRRIEAKFSVTNSFRCYSNAVSTHWNEKLQ